MSFPLSWILLDVLLEENLSLFCPNTRESSHTKYRACFQKPNYFSWHHTLPQSTQKKRQDKLDTDEQSLRTAAGGRMENCNPGMAVRLNPAQRGSPAGILLPEEQRKTARQWLSYTFIPY